MCECLVDVIRWPLDLNLVVCRIWAEHPQVCSRISQLACPWDLGSLSLTCHMANASLSPTQHERCLWYGMGGGVVIITYSGRRYSRRRFNLCHSQLYQHSRLPTLGGRSPGRTLFPGSLCLCLYLASHTVSTCTRPATLGSSNASIAGMATIL